MSMSEQGYRSASGFEPQQPQYGHSGENGGEQGGVDYKKLQNDVTELKNAFSKFTTSASQEAGKAVHSAAAMGSDMASSAADQAKTFASEIEKMARNNPLGALAGALAVGVVIGLVGRGRG